MCIFIILPYENNGVNRFSGKDYFLTVDMKKTVGIME